MKLENSIFVLYIFCCLWYGKGVCGPDIHSAPGIKHAQPRTSVRLPPGFSPSAIVNAFKTADSEIRDTSTTESTLRHTESTLRLDRDQRENAAVFRHNFFQQSVPRSRELQRIQERFEVATRILQEKFDLTPNQVIEGLAAVDLASILRDGSIQLCKNPFNIMNCNPGSRYRTFDGTCNNLEHPSWGMAGSCFARLIPPVYADGISKLRTAASGCPLPRPRKISLEIHSHYDNPSLSLTHMFMQWGQFIDHDMTVAPLQKTKEACCPPPGDKEMECIPTLLEPNDPFFSRLGINCLSNRRTVICNSCALGPREQLNQLTAVIDGSMIYGADTVLSDALRDKNGAGTLKSVVRNGWELLPPSFNPSGDGCSFQSQTEVCFQAGDSRANQQPALTSFHTIFLRHHNQIAKKLQTLNPSWEEEELFEETRRIVIAQLQIITFNEFLPLALSSECMQRYNLIVQREPIYTQYDSTIGPSIFTEFATAAFRFGHTNVNSFIATLSKESSSLTRLRDLFSWPFDLYSNGYLESVIRGMTYSQSQRFDRHLVTDLTNHVYQRRGNESGLDLASLNIMRGRDHGIPPYVKILNFCGGPNITTFRQLDQVFRPFYSLHFSRIYESVEDIDFFTGGLAERPEVGAIVGPTFSCIIGIQFHHLKFGDRFFFEHGEQAGSFTPNQLRELKKTTFARIICNNTDIDLIPERVMQTPIGSNEPVPCDTLADVDLGFWKE